MRSLTQYREDSATFRKVRQAVIHKATALSGDLVLVSETFQLDVSHRWFVCHNWIHTLAHGPSLMSSFKSIWFSFALSKNTHDTHKNNQWIPLDIANQQGFYFSSYTLVEMNLIPFERDTITKWGVIFLLLLLLQHIYATLGSLISARLMWTHGCLATWTDDITVTRFKVLSKASPACPASLSEDKIDALQPTASSPAAACPCGYREVNKL